MIEQADTADGLIRLDRRRNVVQVEVGRAVLGELLSYRVALHKPIGRTKTR